MACFSASEKFGAAEQVLLLRQDEAGPRDAIGRHQHQGRDAFVFRGGHHRDGAAFAVPITAMRLRSMSLRADRSQATAARRVVREIGQ